MSPPKTVLHVSLKEKMPGAPEAGSASLAKSLPSLTRNLHTLNINLLFPLGTIYADKGMYAEAIGDFLKVGDRPHALGHLGNAYARAGMVDAAHKTIYQLEEHLRTDGVGRYEIALVYAGLNEKDGAFAWLEKSYEAHDKGLTYPKIDPCMDPLRSDARFEGLVRRVGLTQ